LLFAIPKYENYEKYVTFRSVQTCGASTVILTDILRVYSNAVSIPQI